MSVNSKDGPVQETITKILLGDQEETGMDEEPDLAETCERKFTEKGKYYQTENCDSKRKNAYSKLSKRMEKIGNLIESGANPEALEAERDKT